MKYKHHILLGAHGKAGILRTALAACLLVFSVAKASAQRPGTWQIYPAYSVATYHEQVGSCIYALMESKLMAYDTEDTSIKTFSSHQQLNDDAISFIRLCPEAKRLVIVYDNGNIDLLSTEDDADVINVASLKESNLQGKDVNHVQVKGKNAYLSTGFGLLVIDVDQGIVMRTYQLGRTVKASAVTDHYIYAGTTEGVYRGNLTDNLMDKTNWKLVDSNVNATLMETFDNCVWARSAKGLFSITESETAFVKSLNNAPDYISVGDAGLVAGTIYNIFVYSSRNDRKQYSGSYNFKHLTLNGKTFWASEGIAGLQSYELNENNQFKVVTRNIRYNSPLHDYSYHLHLLPDKRLLVAGGNWDYASANRPGTAMFMDADGTWTNFDASSATAIEPEAQFINVTDVRQDPNDAAHHYVGTARNGLYEFRDGVCVKNFTCDNSPLLSILPDNQYPKHYVVASALNYDGEGNLWVINAHTDTVFKVIRPNGSWVRLRYADMGNVDCVDQTLFDSRGWLWLNNRRMTDRGIYCLDYNGTLTAQADDRHCLHSGITNQDGLQYKPDQYYCFAEDRDGNIWVGTNLGPFVITEPENFFNADFTYEQVKVAREDGSGLADYLLTGIPVLCIKVDGANRKWIGTESAGVYLISDDCQEEIYHFTAENSPLLSNAVFDIAIDGDNGKVYFATGLGLCSFMADATEPAGVLEEDAVYAFPNPVNPGYDGPITIRGLVERSEVKILSSSGQLIHQGTSVGGTYTWDGRDRNGHKVSTGIYIIIAGNQEGSKAVKAKVAIIR